MKASKGEPPHGSVWQGTFPLFGIELKCHVLSEGQRIIEEDSMVDLFKAMESLPENSCDDAEMVSFVKWLNAGKTPSSLIVAERKRSFERT